MAKKQTAAPEEIEMDLLNSRDEIMRFQQFERKDKPNLISMRKFYLDIDDERKPAKQGITIEFDDIPEFVNKLREVYTKEKELRASTPKAKKAKKDD